MAEGDADEDPLLPSPDGAGPRVPAFGGVRDLVPADPRGDDGVVRCWEVRGCAGIAGLSGLMEDECPHNVPERYSPCPATCAYTRCQRPWMREAVSLEDLLDPGVDRMGTIKEQCRHCMHFIKHGPRARRSGAPVA